MAFDSTKQQNIDVDEKRTSGEEDKVDGSVDTRHGDNILFRRRKCLFDPRERVTSFGSTFKWIHSFQDPIRVINHIVTRST